MPNKLRAWGINFQAQMSNADWFDRIMIFVGIFISLSLIPHIHRMISVQSSLGQSWLSPLGLLIGLSMWVIYGFRHKLITVIITNIVGIIFNLGYLFTILYYQ
jgi:uncharacterized protein with PQ loop repeat